MKFYTQSMNPLIVKIIGILVSRRILMDFVISVFLCAMFHFGVNMC